MSRNLQNQKAISRIKKTKLGLKKAFKEDEPGNFLKSQDYEWQKNNKELIVESSSSDEFHRVYGQKQVAQDVNQLSFNEFKQKAETYIARRNILNQKSVELPSNLHLIPQLKSSKQAKHSQSIFDYTMQRLLNQTFTSEEEQNEQLESVKQQIKMQIEQQKQIESLNSSMVWRKKQQMKQQVLVSLMGQKEDSPVDQKNEIENMDKIKFQLLSRTSVTNSSKFSITKQNALKLDSPYLTQDSQDTCKQVSLSQTKQDTLKGTGSFTFSSIKENQQSNQANYDQSSFEEDNYKRIPEFDSYNQQNNQYQRRRSNSFFQKNYKVKEQDNSSVLQDQDFI